MAADLFVDTSGLYALADHRDPLRAQAKRHVSARVTAGARLVLTDYVVDEACTLAKARAGSYAAFRLLELIETSAGFRLEFVGPDRFETAKAHFRKHGDHDYSFTDCASFVVMRELRLRDALTSDRHFTEAGFSALLLEQRSRHYVAPQLTPRDAGRPAGDCCRDLRIGPGTQSRRKPGGSFAAAHPAGDVVRRTC